MQSTYNGRVIFLSNVASFRTYNNYQNLHKFYYWCEWPWKKKHLIFLLHSSGKIVVDMTISLDVLARFLKECHFHKFSKSPKNRKSINLRGNKNCIYLQTSQLAENVRIKEKEQIQRTNHRKNRQWKCWRPWCW